MAIAFHMEWKIVKQRSHVICHGIYDFSHIFSRYTHEPLGESVYRENLIGSWDIPRCIMPQPIFRRIRRFLSYAKF